MPQSFRETVGIPASTASSSDSTLLIIDAQNEYANGLLKTVNVDSTRAAIAGLVDKYRVAGQESNIVHILHKVPDGAPVFTPGKPVSKEMDGVGAKGNEKVIMKEHPGSFTGTDLQETLEKTGAKKVVLCGYMAHVCVSTTARQAAERGYDVLLAEDAIGDRDIPGISGQEVTKVALLELADAFGTVVKSSEIK